MPEYDFPVDARLNQDGQFGVLVVNPDHAHLRNDDTLQTKELGYMDQVAAMLIALNETNPELVVKNGSSWSVKNPSTGQTIVLTYPSVRDLLGEGIEPGGGGGDTSLASLYSLTFSDGGTAQSIQLYLPEGSSHLFWWSNGVTTAPTGVGSPTYHEVGGSVSATEEDVAAAFAQSIVNTGEWEIEGYNIQGVPEVVFAPTIDTLNPSDGDTINATTGTWTESPTSYTYQWFKNGVSLTGETGSSYVVDGVEDDEITVEVTAHNEIHDSDPALCADPAIVAPPVLTFINETFEGAGTPVGAASSGSGTIDYHYATNPGAGSKSMRLAASSQQPGVTWTFTAKDTIYIRFMLRMNALINTEKSLLFFNAGGQIDFRSNGAFIIRDGAGGDLTNDVMSTGVWYYCQAIIAKGSGSNAVLSFEFNTSESFSGFGNKFTGQTDGANTSQITSFMIGWAGDGNADGDFQIDNLQARETPFP